MNSNIFVIIISSAIFYGTPLFFAALGGILTERSGVLNLGVEGTMLIGGVSGACINIVSGAPDQLNNTQQQNMMPPEVAGTASLVKAVWPIVIATLGSLPMVAAREAIDNGRGAPAAATRTAIAIVLLGGLVAGWIRFRDDIKNWFANAAAESRGQKRNGASS